MDPPTFKIEGIKYPQHDLSALDVIAWLAERMSKMEKGDGLSVIIEEEA